MTRLHANTAALAKHWGQEKVWYDPHTDPTGCMRAQHLWQIQYTIRSVADGFALVSMLIEELHLSVSSALLPPTIHDGSAGDLPAGQLLVRPRPRGLKLGPGPRAPGLRHSNWRASQIIV